MLNLFDLVSGSERNAVEERRGGVRAIWAKCDLSVVPVKCFKKI